MKHLLFAAFLLSGWPALAELPIVPDHTLTPGKSCESHARVVCQTGYSKTMRHTSGSLKHRVYEAYHISNEETHAEVDHLMSLELGGCDEFANLWIQSYDTCPWNAYVKDDLENKVHAWVCSALPNDAEADRRLAVAQTRMAEDWIGLWKETFGMSVPNKRCGD